MDRRPVEDKDALAERDPREPPEMPIPELDQETQKEFSRHCRHFREGTETFLALAKRHGRNLSPAAGQQLKSEILEHDAGFSKLWVNVSGAMRFCATRKASAGVIDGYVNLLENGRIAREQALVVASVL